MTDETTPGPSRVRRFLRRLAVVVLCVVGLEAGLRVVAYLVHGRSEYYLYYGFHDLGGRVGISPWSVYNGQYFKFPPHFELKGAAGQDSETAHTNNLGFRGPDFAPEKLAGTFRIVCTGGSSTFGFHNDDDGTYPVQLQALMDRDFPDVEVINAGFPYYHSGCILGLLEDEVLGYEPDVITIYSAYNDTSWPLELSKSARWAFWIQEHSITYLLLKETVLTDQRIYTLKSKLAAIRAPSYDVAAVDAHGERIAERYGANVRRILELAHERGIRVVLVRQPMTVHYQDDAGAERLSYEQEYAQVREKLESGGNMSFFDFCMIHHHKVVHELERIAAEADLPLVDNIALVDAHKEGLASWVHLTKPANGRLAAALAETIAPMIVEARAAR